jgi:hypothetical protein
MATGNGPFQTFTPTPEMNPGVYTQTFADANVTNILGGLRIPAIIGVGQEELVQDDLELVRGSSASIDQQIVNEDPSLAWVADATNPQNLILGAQDGTRTQFRVRNFPIVDGSGLGRVSNATKDISSITVNGLPVALGAVQGAKGLITLQIPPQPTDVVRVTYFFHRGDTAFTDDVSDQVTNLDAILTSPGFEPFLVTTGSNDSFVVKVGGTSYTVTLTAGSLTASNVKSQIDAAIIPNLQTAVSTDNQGLKHVALTSPVSLEIGSGSANGPLGFLANTKTSRNLSFRVFQRPIVDGTSGGITTTDPSKVVVKVNGAQVIPTSVDGTNGVVTLATPPARGAVVTVQYWANTWQDTFDYLPNTFVTTVARCGISNGRSDFIQGQDFVVSNPSADVSIIHWGTSFVVASTKTSPGSTPFNESQIVGSLVDEKLYLATCARVTDTSVLPAKVSTTDFRLPEIPTTGNGRSTPLGNSLYASITNNRQDLITNRPDLIQVFVGRTLRDALGRAAVKVLTVDGASRLLRLRDAVPPDWNAYATFNYNRIVDDTYILTCTVPGAVGMGQYEVFSVQQNTNLFQVRFGSKSSLSETVQWPRGVETVPDAFHSGTGTPVVETVTVTFGSAAATNAAFTNNLAEPYSFYAPSSATWSMGINGNTQATNLASAAPAFLVSGHVVPVQSGGNSGKILIPASPANVLNLSINAGVLAASGLITTVAGSLLVDGETFTLDDGVNPPSIFEFDSGGGVASGNVAVAFTSLDSVGTVRDAMISAINGVGAGLAITASIGGSTKVALVNGATGTVGNAAITETVANAGFVVVGMTGGNGLINVPLTVGYRTPTQLVADINAVIDATAPFSGTAPNTLASFHQIGGSTGDVFFVVKSDTTPGALPGGFDDISTVMVSQGTAETLLGFTTFQSSHGTTGAINKPATLLGSLVGPFNITAGVNDTFKFRVNGAQYLVTLPAGATVATSAVVSAINAVATGRASAGTGINLDKLRLTSSTNDPQSSVLILDGTANVVLGFAQNAQGSQTLVSAQEVVDALLATAGFLTDGVAYVDTINGSNYITFESLTVGAASSSIVFNTVANSAFNATTGIGLTAGVDGDNGEDAQDNFVVSSNNASGSAGTGIPGQTYTDAQTGLRFTVLPATTGGYDAAGTFTLLVTPTFAVDPSRPFLAIAGLELGVANTVGVAVNDTATVQTFNPGGVEPKVGDFYYITYNFLKQDFSTRIFRTIKTIEQNFGLVSAENRVSLAAYLAITNGALLVGIKQVMKAANTAQATDVSFLDAIDELKTPLPGNVKPDILVPLATSTAVYSRLTQHVETQSHIRNQAERMGFCGFASGTSPTNAQTIARSLNSNRMAMFYPDSAVITLSDALGQTFDSLVDGTFFAAAVAGAVVSPSVDVATPWTRRRIVNFTRIPRIMDPVEANQTAAAGITLLEDLQPLVRIRQGLTTNMSSPLTRLPTVTQIADYVQQQSRIVLDSFVGSKFLASRTNEVNVSMTGLFKQLVQAEIVGAFSGIASAIDPNDPTILRFQAFYQPVFPLLFLVLSFNLRARI